MENWYIIYNGSQVGPISESQLMAYNPTPDTMVWREGMSGWLPISAVPELAHRLQQPQPQSFQAAPQQPYQQSYQQPYQQPYQQQYQQQYQQPVYQQPSSKDKTVAGILAILLGGFGVHYFYLGKVGGGFICLLLSFVTCGIWSIVTLIQGILMLTMSQQEFDNKFVYSDSTFPLF